MREPAHNNPVACLPTDMCSSRIWRTIRCSAPEQPRMGPPQSPHLKRPQPEASSTVPADMRATAAVEPTAQASSWPTALTEPLPATVAARMLLDSRYQPGKRPSRFDPLGGRFVFKERGGSRPYSSKGDRYHNSGGKNAARDMHVEAGAVRVRRRYGSISNGDAIKWRFHQYSLVRRVADKNLMAAVMAAMSEGAEAVAQSAAEAARLATSVDEWIEDRSCSVFHVMPSRSRRGRPRRKAEADQAELWAGLAPGLAWDLSDSCIDDGDKLAGCVANAGLQPALPQQLARTPEAAGTQPQQHPTL